MNVGEESKVLKETSASHAAILTVYALEGTFVCMLLWQVRVIAACAIMRYSSSRISCRTMNARENKSNDTNLM